MPFRFTTIVLGSLLCAACASKTQVGTTKTTNAQYVSSFRESEGAAQNLVSGHYDEALALADKAVSTAPQNPWAHYQRGVALQGIGRSEAAASSFREAEKLFGPSDRWGTAISIYGRARALNDVGRCEEARTAYFEYASFVRSFDVKAADQAVAYSKQCRPPAPGQAVGDLVMSELVTDVMAGRYEHALAMADRASEPARQSGWLDYNRGVALAGLARTDDALVAYREAERKFGTSDPYRRAIAIFGRARALDQAKRCSEAKLAYGEFAELVRRTAPHDAEMAMAQANACAIPR